MTEQSAPGIDCEVRNDSDRVVVEFQHRNGKVELETNAQGAFDLAELINDAARRAKASEFTGECR